jgi:cytochrome c-type biogenesis protein
MVKIIQKTEERDMEYVVVFFEGIITFISPCLLPLLPVYLSYFASGQEEEKNSLKNALGFVVGFTLVFIILGAFAGTVGRFLRERTVIVNIITGGIVIFFGLHFLGIIRIGFFNRTFFSRHESKEATFFRSVLFGMVFSVSWTPCVGAFLGSALMLATQSGSVVKGVLMLLAYSIGLGIPFILSALLIAKLKSAFDFIKKHYGIINKISGIFLIVVGLLMATGLFGSFLSLLSY